MINGDKEPNSVSIDLGKALSVHLQRLSQEPQSRFYGYRINRSLRGIYPHEGGEQIDGTSCGMPVMTAFDAIVGIWPQSLRSFADADACLSLPKLNIVGARIKEIEQIEKRVSDLLLQREQRRRRRQQ